MPDASRIDDLRRRVRQDPASIAFAQLAEEYRRAGQLNEAVDTCRSGLSTHPEYVSARVTLGRALLALGRLDDARAELGLVLAVAPENLAAVRALAETCRRQGHFQEALAHFTTAQTLAPNDPDLERMVRDLAQAIAAGTRREPDPAQLRDRKTIAVLERWLEAIDAARTQRSA